MEKISGVCQAKVGAMLRAKPLRKGPESQDQKESSHRGLTNGDERIEPPPFLSMTRSSCVCDGGWTGPECDTDLGGCVSTPCAHGGTCHPQPFGYNCTCPTGYTGEALPKPCIPWADHHLNQGQGQWRHVSKGLWVSVTTKKSWDFLVVQWLRLCTSTAGDMGLIPGPRTKIPHACCRCSQKN